MLLGYADDASTHLHVMSAHNIHIAIYSIAFAAQLRSNALNICSMQAEDTLDKQKPGSTGLGYQGLGIIDLHVSQHGFIYGVNLDLA